MGFLFRETEAEAAAITKWCGFDAGGMVKQCHRSTAFIPVAKVLCVAGGVCLTLIIHSALWWLAMDSMVCEALLSESVGCIPAFVMATISSEDYSSPALQQRD